MSKHSHLHAKVHLEAAMLGHGQKSHGDLSAEIAALRNTMQATYYIIKELRTSFIQDSLTDDENEYITQVEKTLAFYYGLEEGADV